MLMEGYVGGHTDSKHLGDVFLVLPHLKINQVYWEKCREGKPWMTI